MVCKVLNLCLQQADELIVLPSKAKHSAARIVTVGDVRHTRTGVQRPSGSKGGRERRHPHLCEVADLIAGRLTLRL